MKVLMISEYFPPFSKGGGEISAYLLAKELSKKKVEVHVLTSIFKGLKKQEIKEGIIFHRNLKTGEDPSSLVDNLKRTLFFNRSLLKEVGILHKEEKYDIIHCFNTTSIVAIDLKHKIKKPFVMHVNSPVPFCPKGTLMYKDKETCNLDCSRKTFLHCFLHSDTVGKHELNGITKYNPLVVFYIRKRYEDYQKRLLHFDFFMPISTFMKNRLMLSGVPGKKIQVVYNLSEYYNLSKFKFPKNKVPKILYLGPYTKPKGPQILLEALKGVRVPFEANFYGSGGLKQELIKETLKNELNVKIHRPVNYNKIPMLLHETDIVVFPSLVGEAFGRVVLEACIAGKNVIASKVGGVTDIIEDNKTGYLFSPGNIHELRNLIEKVINSRKSLNTKDRIKKLKKKFSNKKTISQVTKIYNQLITK